MVSTLLLTSVILLSAVPASRAVSAAVSLAAAGSRPASSTPRERAPERRRVALLSHGRGGAASGAGALSEARSGLGGRNAQGWPVEVIGGGNSQDYSGIGPDAFGTNFRFLDNMDPVAPMDSVSPPSSVSTLGVEPLPGEHHNSLYIAPYRNPDPFPTALGRNCNCELPPTNAPVTDEQKDWAKQVARQLGIKISQLPKPMSTEGRIKCECTGDGHSEWTRVEPVFNSSNFTLKSADITFPAGDYWAPNIKGGIVAPEERLPLAHYPLMAPADQIETIPGVAQEDRIPLKYARYIDQVSARSQSCEGDGITERCITDCRPGDKVQALLGSMVLEASIVSTHVGGAAVIEYVPAPTRSTTGSVINCPLQALCSSFRLCRSPGKWCQRQETEHPRDFLGNLHLSLACPPGTSICRTVQQLVLGKLLKKDGKSCKPMGPDKPV